MRYYPVFLDLRGKKCVVVGGGAVAERKVLSLLEASASVTVISPRLTERLASLKSQGRISHINRTYCSGDLNGAVLAIAATENQQTNRTVSQEARQRGIPVNVVDTPELCTFIVPSIIRRGPLVIAISTSGASPAIAKTLRQQIETLLPEGLEQLLTALQKTRQRILSEIRDGQQRIALLQKIGSEEVLHILSHEGVDAAIEYVESLLRSHH